MPYFMYISSILVPFSNFLRKLNKSEFLHIENSLKGILHFWWTRLFKGISTVAVVDVGVLIGVVIALAVFSILAIAVENQG